MRKSGNQGIRVSPLGDALRRGNQGVGLCFLGLLILLCHSCDTTAPGIAGAVDTAGKPIAIETTPPETKPAPATSFLPAPAIAKIGDYVITIEELEKRIISELQPKYRQYQKQAEPVNAKTVLLKMIAEKAMVIEGRKLNYLEDETIQASLKRFKGKKLTSLLLANYLKGKITVTEAEIDEKIKTNPKLSRAQAQEMVGRAKANIILSQYYKELCEKRHLQKLSGNFPEAARIHQRLLLHPKEPRRMRLVRIPQIKNELTPEEKNIVLAAYDTGKVTLKDWFDTLCKMSPPSRPRDLHTVAGVERLLDKAIRTPVFVAEARLLGLDKDENLLKEIRDQEDMHLFNKAQREKVKDISGPISEEQIIAYFEKNKGAFGTQNTLRIDQIWCQDLKTAQKVKDELDGGKDFKAVRQKYSLQKKASPFNTSGHNEAIFFKDLWKGDPNEIVGPVKGFYRGQVKWRIVKILEKTPGKMKEYSSSIKDHIKMVMQDEQRNAALENYRKELLEKYPYEISAERLRDIDPLDIP